MSFDEESPPSRSMRSWREPPVQYSRMRKPTPSRTKKSYIEIIFGWQSLVRTCISETDSEFSGRWKILQTKSSPHFELSTT